MLENVTKLTSLVEVDGQISINSMIDVDISTTILAFVRAETTIEGPVTVVTLMFGNEKK
jgi:hypothetical protein